VIVNGKVLDGRGESEPIDEQEALSSATRGIAIARRSGLDRITQSPCRALGRHMGRRPHQDIDWVVTVDGSRRMIADGAIAIGDDRIAAIGKSSAIERECGG